MTILRVAGGGLMLVALVVGCGGASSDDALVKDFIQTMDEMAGIMEKVTDAKSMNEAKSKLNQVKAKSEELSKKLDAIPKERSKALEEKYKGQIENCKNRLMKAMMGAAMKGVNLEELK